MTLETILREVVNGSTTALLNSCRLEAGGGEAFGSEAVAAKLRTASLDLKDAWFLEGGHGAAIVANDAAVVADLHGPNIGRLWVISPTWMIDAEPAVGVAFDTDLHQERANVIFDPRDHPGLTDDGAARARGLASSLLSQGLAQWIRARAFIIRAFGDNERGLALLALYRLANAPIRTGGFCYAVAAWSGEGTRTVYGRPWADPLARLVQELGQASSSNP